MNPTENNPRGGPDHPTLVAGSWVPTVWERLKVLNESADVVRLHTVRTIRNWTVGRHTFGAQLIAVELCKINKINPGRCLLELLYHDAPECWTGDVPAPTKRSQPGVREALDSMENLWMERWQIPKFRQDLVDQNIPVPEIMGLEVAICKAADVLDLGMCCLLERELGNRNPVMEAVFNNVIAYLKEVEWVPGVPDLKAAFINDWSKQ